MVLARSLVLFAVSAAVLATGQWQAGLTPARKAALDTISSDSLKGHLSFIASDLLEGRDSPSRGLDLAAEYIAAQFRRSGLRPVGDEGYFQTTTFRGGKVRNVIGVLDGSDPKLKDTYILVTAHYDHVGLSRNANATDKVFNGANDDGSGTVSVIELASALSKLPQKPKRSIVFMCFYGEEHGLVGSRYYGRNPIFPLAKTIAHVNLEVVGRTDDIEGARVGAAVMTGFDYSDVGPIFAGAGKAVGVRVEKHPKNSDAFFSRSDNQALADLGIPAHTICTAFMYPDYHQPGDEWQKIDYENMAKINRMVGLGLLTLADSTAEPAWNTSNPRVTKYRAAWERLKGKS